jgi:esterase/lipase superfamily enzyme
MRMPAKIRVAMLRIALAGLLLAPWTSASAQILTTDPDTDRPGMDYRNFDLAEARPELCRKACANESKCVAYSYVKPGVQGPTARCWLKSRIPPQVSSSCCISGVKAIAAGVPKVEPPRPPKKPDEPAPQAGPPPGGGQGAPPPVPAPGTSPRQPSDTTAIPPQPAPPAAVRPETARLYPVWYGTNRRPLDPLNDAMGFSPERDRIVHYGKVFVEIPKSHTFGSVGSSWWKRWRTGIDDRLKIQRLLPMPADAFWRDIAETLARESPLDPSVLVYIHGYNVSFEESAIRAAQIGFDLKVPGITSFFSWPSRGTAAGYAADEATVEASADQLSQFLVTMARGSGSNRVHIIAHSMGNRALLQAFHRATARAAIESGVRFGQIFLAAPDVDSDVFRELASVYPGISERTTLYVSGRDRAVEASNWLHQYARAGYAPPVTVLGGIDTVEVSNIDLTLLGHGYYAEAHDVLRDMNDLLLHNSPPQRRLRLIEKRDRDGLAFWAIQ